MNPVKKILVPVDITGDAAPSLAAAATIADKTGAGVWLLSVVQTFTDYDGFFVPQVPLAQLEEELATAAEKRLEQLAGDNKPLVAGFEVVTGDAAAEIVRYAGEQDIDLILMPTHGFRGVEKMLFGSVAERVIPAAPCPVLTLRTTGAA